MGASVSVAVGRGVDEGKEVGMGVFVTEIVLVGVPCVATNGVIAGVHAASIQIIMMTGMRNFAFILSVF